MKYYRDGRSKKVCIVLYYHGVSGPSLLIESTDSMINDTNTLTRTNFSISSLLCHHFLLLQPGLPPWTSLRHQLLQYLSGKGPMAIYSTLKFWLTASWCFLKSLLSLFSLPLSSSLLSSLSNGSILLELDPYKVIN